MHVSVYVMGIIGGRMTDQVQTMTSGSADWHCPLQRVGHL